jgi:hypothetical protein
MTSLQPSAINAKSSREAPRWPGALARSKKKHPANIIKEVFLKVQLERA